MLPNPATTEQMKAALGVIRNDEMWRCWCGCIWLLTGEDVEDLMYHDSYEDMLVTGSE